MYGAYTRDAATGGLIIHDRGLVFFQNGLSQRVDCSEFDANYGWEAGWVEAGEVPQEACISPEVSTNKYTMSA